MPVKIFKYITIAYSLLTAKYFKKRPIFATLHVTNKCQLNCLYCDYWKARDDDELNIIEIKKIINVLKKAGTKWLHITGGEPLIRDDLPQILKYAKSKNLSISLNTNGVLLERRFKEISEFVDLYKISLDGSQTINDKIRGSLSYISVIKSLELLKESKKKILITSVISNVNYKNLEDILNIAKKYNSQVSFQFASPYKLKSGIENSLCLNKTALKYALNKLLEFKKNNYKKYINNSLNCLKYLEGKKSPKGFKCYLPKIGVRIYANGDISLCDINLSDKKTSCKKTNFIDAYSTLNKSIYCSYPCWCTGRIELNLLMSFKMEQIISSLRALM